ncbi:hypothetical protein QJQ45_001488 [Haematococcus lacustris]|nr:hypothetical protein QJQ45_001488 [Haematococcus lacustris]
MLGVTKTHLLVLCGLTVLAAPGLVSRLHLLFARSSPLAATQQFDVAVVLGYALFRNGSLTTPLKARVQEGVRLWQEGAAAHIIWSGAQPGPEAGPSSEASAMAAWALALLPSPSTIQSEEEKQEKQEEEEQQQGQGDGSAQCPDGQQLPRRWTRILVVTNTFHQLRARLVFLKALQELAGMTECQSLRCRETLSVDHYKAVFVSV